MLGDCDVVVAELCRRAGWELKHEMVPRGQKVEVTLQEGFPSRWMFRVVDGDGGDENGERDGDRTSDEQQSK
jgi:NAD-dependent histone deacetylase SIR2